MTSDELRDALQNATGEQPVVLFLDTNAVYLRRLVELANEASRWRDRANKPDVLRLCVSPIVCAERNAQERRWQRTLGRDFRSAKVWEFLASKGVDVPAFDRAIADAVSERLDRWFPDDDMWRSAKWERVCDLYAPAEDSPKPTPKHRQISATVDWFIAASSHDDWILVTDDAGDEFARVARKVRYQVAFETIRDADSAT